MGAGDKLPPKFTTKPSLRQEGSAIVFSCDLEAAPQPDFSWFLGDSKLEVNKDRITAKCDSKGNNTYSLTLTIAGVTPADSGSYRVEAKNQYGQMSSNINLNLEGRYRCG